MIEKDHPKLSLRNQCELLGINRNPPQEKPQPSSAKEDLKIMKDLDIIYTKWPFLGQRKLRLELIDQGWKIGRKRVRRLMKIMGIEALVPKPSLSAPNKKHKVYPYLLRDLKVTEVDQVWCADITYIPMEKGHAYLVAIMDWKSRAVLSWELSKHHGQQLLRAGTQARDEGHRTQTQNLQHRPGQPVHWGGLDWRTQSQRHKNHAWMAKGAGWTTSSSSVCGAV